jgi:hypothetical protein
MAVAINQVQRPQENKESDLDKLAKFIQLGANVYGVKDSYDKGLIAQDHAAREKTVFDQGQEQIAQLKDVNSPMARAYAKAFNQAGVQVDPSMSMYQNKQIYGDPSELLKAKISAQSRHTGLEGMIAEERLNAMKRAAKEAQMPSQKQLDEIQQFDDSINALKDIMGSARENYVGPLSGRTPEMLVSGDESAFRSKSGRYSDIYRKNITGAGAGDKELARLEGRLPNVTDLPENFMGKGNDILKATLAAKARYLENLSRTGKNVADYKSPDFAPITMFGLKPQPKPTMVNGAPNFNVPTANAGQGPQPGTVENGYRFKGGNPADQNSWEKVK